MNNINNERGVTFGSFIIAMFAVSLIIFTFFSIYDKNNKETVTIIDDKETEVLEENK